MIRGCYAREIQNALVCFLRSWTCAKSHDSTLNFACHIFTFLHSLHRTFCGSDWMNPMILVANFNALLSNVTITHLTESGKMRVMIVYGRTLDDNIKQLYSACKRHFGKPILTRIMDLSAYIGPDGSEFWHADEPLNQVDVCFLRSFGPGSCEQVTKRVSMMEHLELSAL